MQFGLRSLPTAVYPATSNEAKTWPEGVTLTTTKAQESWSYVRSRMEEMPASDAGTDPRERLLNPDLDPETYGQLMFIRPEAVHSFISLPSLRPSVLWLYGEDSPINVPTIREEKMRTTGTGLGGSGGERMGMVKQVVLSDQGHLLPFENPQHCAEEAAKWAKIELSKYWKEKEFWKEHDSGKSDRGMLVLSERWKKAVKEPADVKRPRREKL